MDAAKLRNKATREEETKAYRDMPRKRGPSARWEAEFPAHCLWSRISGRKKERKKNQHFNTVLANWAIGINKKRQSKHSTFTSICSLRYSWQRDTAEEEEKTGIRHVSENNPGAVWRWLVARRRLPPPRAWWRTAGRVAPRCAPSRWNRAAPCPPAPGAHPSAGAPAAGPGCGEETDSPCRWKTNSQEHVFVYLCPY